MMRAVLEPLVDEPEEGVVLHRIENKTGIIGLMLYLTLFTFCSLRNCRKQFMFARLFMIYFLFANITASWYFQIDGIICICICTYLLGDDYYRSQILIRLDKNALFNHNTSL